MPRAMSLSVKAMVATAAPHPEMWGRQKMWGCRPFDQKCGDVKWGPENVGTSTGCGDVAGNGKCGDVAGAKMWVRLQVLENVGTSPDVPTFFPAMKMWGRCQNVGTS